MSLNPFTPDPKIRISCEAASIRLGGGLAEEIKNLLGNGHRPSGLGGVLSAEQATSLLARHGLAGIEELMLLLLPAARAFAHPVISGFYVGAVGLERGSGDLLLGGNVEFPGSHLGLTIHGETCLAARAFSRGGSLAKIALGQAHPCGHCRQFLSEFASAPELRLIDPLGHGFGLSDLLPWPFDPNYLGDPGAIDGAVNWPDLALEVQGPIGARLIEAGSRSHAPYSGNPAAALCIMADGTAFSGSALESVAFNPSMGPLQMAIVNLIACGYQGSDIAEIHVAEKADAAVSHAGQADMLAKAFSPGAALLIHHWRS